jgi:pimeloyl-ACP methyl ester carboxylesterase
MRRRPLLRFRGPRLRPGRRPPEGAEWGTATLDGYRLHWLSAGSGPAVVLLHGLCGSHRWWNANIPSLAEEFRVLAPDLPGFGRSRYGGRLPDLAGTAELLARWIAEAGAPRSHLVGHSMGGHLAVHLAARHPDQVDRLVLADAAGLLRPLSPVPLARWAYGLAWPRAWGSPAFLPVIWRDALRAGPFTAARAIRHILRDDVSALLPGIRAPTLVVWGEADAMIPLEHGQRLRDAIPGARMHVIPGAYHNPMVDRPAEFNQVVRAFLRGEEVGA